MTGQLTKLTLASSCFMGISICVTTSRNSRPAFCMRSCIRASDVLGQRLCKQWPHTPPNSSTIRTNTHPCMLGPLRNTPLNRGPYTLPSFLAVAIEAVPCPISSAILAAGTAQRPLPQKALPNLRPSCLIQTCPDLSKPIVRGTCTDLCSQQTLCISHDYKSMHACMRLGIAKQDHACMKFFSCRSSAGRHKLGRKTRPIAHASCRNPRKVGTGTWGLCLQLGSLRPSRGS